jgi:hypothetical protein
MFNQDLGICLSPIANLTETDQEQQIKFFIDAVETVKPMYFNLRFNPNATARGFMTLIYTKLSPDMKSEAARAETDGNGMLSIEWESFRFWIRNRRNPHLVNRVARLKLRNFDQGSLSINQTMKTMRAINDDVSDYAFKQDDFNIATSQHS